MTATLVLTRPEAQSRALAAVLAVELGDAVRIMVAPIIEIVCTGHLPDLTGCAGVILTSANAVRCGPPLAGMRVHCVGETTAAAAREAGATVATVAPDAAALIAAITGPGPLLHLRGEHARGDIAARLDAAGIETGEAVIYAQAARDLDQAARAAIAGPAPVVLPLYSPRSARLIGEALRPGPQVAAIAMSTAVARAWTEATGGTAEVCDTPTGAEMRHRIVAALRRMSP